MAFNRLVDRDYYAKNPRTARRALPSGLVSVGFVKSFTAVTALLQHRIYQRNEVIINAGDEARELFLLTRGNASVLITLASGAKKRLATFAAGMAFGEMAIIDRAPRSAMIVADSEVECHLLKLEDFERLSQTHPNIKIRLLENLSLSLCRKLRKANRELSVFE